MGASAQNRVLTFHGFNTKGRQMDLLEDKFQDHDIPSVNVNYGWTSLLSVWKVSRSVAKAVSGFVQPDDVLIGHSNGCNVINEIIRLGVEFDQAVYISPALNRDMEIAVSARLNWIHVMATPHDKAVSLARWVPASSWGDMGRVGYTGDNPIYKTEIYPEIKGHSDWFRDIDTLYYQIVGKVWPESVVE